MSFMSTRIQLSSLKYNSWKEKGGGGGIAPFQVSQQMVEGNNNVAISWPNVL